MVQQSHPRCVAQSPFRDAASRDHFRLCAGFWTSAKTKDPRNQLAGVQKAPRHEVDCRRAFSLRQLNSRRFLGRGQVGVLLYTPDPGRIISRNQPIGVSINARVVDTATESQDLRATS